MSRVCTFDALQKKKDISNEIFPTEFISLEIFEFIMEFFEGIDSVGN